MKRLLFLLIAGSYSLSAIAQQPAATYLPDSLLSHWVIDVNLLGGGLSQKYTTANTTGNYPNGVNVFPGSLKFSNGASFGFDAQLGYFFGHSNHFGIGLGLNYMAQSGKATLDSFHAEYQVTDNNPGLANGIYRQVVSSDQAIQESLHISNLNIPILLKYKTRFSKHWGFMADAGALINLQIKNSYNTNASFNYEAIYAYGDGGIPYYDNASTPGASDVLITKAQYYKNTNPANIAPTVQDYFKNEQAAGYNVGLNEKPTSNTGKVSFMSGSVGLMVRPAFNYFLSDNVALTFGGYYIYQPFKNSATSGYELTNGIGNYSSVLNNVTAAKLQSYGLNLGVRIFLGHSAPPAISSIEPVAPTLCGTCDGSMTLHGLKPGKKVMVNYNFNGNPHAPYSGEVDANGNVVITGLCAGNYTDIIAKVGRRTAKGYPVTIIDPALVITSENPTNPSAAGKCDATITLNGLYAGKAVTISYNVNGTPQPPYSGVVGPDNTVTLTGLCEGRYSGIVATINSCTANGNDITLTAPAPPPPPPPPPAPVVETPNISQPILFQVNKTIIHKSSYPVLEDAVKTLNAQPGSYVEVNGYTDITGKPAYNRKLSMKRARAVKTYLEKMGVDGKRIHIKGNGSKSPVATNKTREGRQQNRRAVMSLSVGE